MIINVNFYFKDSKFFRYHLDTEVFPTVRVKRLLKTLNTIPNMDDAIAKMQETLKDVAKREYTTEAEQTWLLHHKETGVEVQRTNFSYDENGKLTYSRGELLDEFNV